MRARPLLVLDHTTPDKPEVLGIARRLGISPGDAFTGCVRVWCWAQAHTADGDAPGVRPKALDDLVGVAGFALAMEAEGWLVVYPGGLAVPRFEKLIALTASKGAMAAARRARAAVGPAEAALPAGLNTPAFRAAWREWCEHRRQKRNALTPVAVARQLKLLERLGEEEALVCLARSMTNGWTGLFPERRDGPGPRGGVGPGGGVRPPKGKYADLGTRCGPEAEPDARRKAPAPRAEEPEPDSPLFAGQDPEPGPG